MHPDEMRLKGKEGGDQSPRERLKRDRSRSRSPAAKRFLTSSRTIASSLICLLVCTFVCLFVCLFVRSFVFVCLSISCFKGELPSPEGQESRAVSLAGEAGEGEAQGGHATAREGGDHEGGDRSTCLSLVNSYHGWDGYYYICIGKKGIHTCTWVF